MDCIDDLPTSVFERATGKKQKSLEETEEVSEISGTALSFIDQINSNYLELGR